MSSGFFGRNMFSAPSPPAFGSHLMRRGTIMSAAAYEINAPLKSPIDKLVDHDATLPVMKDESGEPITFSYGTAGFRTLGS